MARGRAKHLQPAHLAPPGWGPARDAGLHAACLDVSTASLEVGGLAVIPARRTKSAATLAELAQYLSLVFGVKMRASVVANQVDTTK
nr:hypothetical protein [Gammaproteobacteria bacterium]